MIKVNFYLKSDKQNKNGESAIYAQLHYKGKKATISTGKHISRDRWKLTNHLKKIVKKKSEKMLQVILKKIVDDVNQAYLDLVNNQKDIDVSILKKKLKGHSEKQIWKFSNAADLHNSNFEKLVKKGERSPATLQKYKRTNDLFIKFLKLKYKVQDIEAAKITNEMIFGFEDYLKFECVYKGKKGIGNNTTVKYMRHLSTIFNYSLKRDKIAKNPSQCYEGKVVEKDAVFLTVEELERLVNKSFKTVRLERVKDIFLFSCYTGYAPSLVQSLQPRDILKDNEGTLWLKTDRLKTKIACNIPILPPAQRIIERYAGVQPGKLLPKISNQKVNEYLKEIADLCGIDKNLTHYVARHTFATTVTLGNGISLEVVSKMMGHTNLKQTQHYAKILDRNVKKEMEKLNRIFV